MRIEDMVRKDESNRYFNKLSTLLLLKTYRDNKWEFEFYILRLKGSKGSTHLNGLASPAKVKIILNIEYVIVDSSLVTRRDCQRDTLQLKAAFKELWKISGKWCFRRTVGSLSWQQRKWREEGWVFWAVADPGEGPGGPAPLFLAQTEARRAENIFLRLPRPPAPHYLRV